MADFVIENFVRKVAKQKLALHLALALFVALPVLGLGIFVISMPYFPLSLLNGDMQEILTHDLNNRMVDAAGCRPTLFFTSSTSINEFPNRALLDCGTFYLPSEVRTTEEEFQKTIKLESRISGTVAKLLPTSSIENLTKMLEEKRLELKQIFPRKFVIHKTELRDIFDYAFLFLLFGGLSVFILFRLGVICRELIHPTLKFFKTANGRRLNQFEMGQIESQLRSEKQTIGNFMIGKEWILGLSQSVSVALKYGEIKNVRVTVARIGDEKTNFANLVIGKYAPKHATYSLTFNCNDTDKNRSYDFWCSKSDLDQVTEILSKKGVVVDSTL